MKQKIREPIFEYILFFRHKIKVLYLVQIKVLGIF